MGGVIRVSDLPHGGKFRFITDENAAVAHIAAVKQDAATEDALAAAAAEPEVAKKGKPEAAAAEKK